MLKPENLQIRIVRAEKGIQTDSYSGGCDLNSYKFKPLELKCRQYPTIAAAFQDLVEDKTITANEITTLDPNIYCDLKSGGTRTVTDNTATGLFRCNYNRNENSHGRKPSATENDDFKADKITLKLADYDIYFNLQIIGLDETKLSKLIGCNNW